VWPQIPDDVLEAVGDALRRSRYDQSILNGLSGEGPLQEFESAFARHLGVKHALAVNSGASALHLALIAAGVGPGDEVIVSAYGWGQILVFIDALDAVPVFADIDPATLGLDPNSVAARLSDRTRAIVVTHFAGCPADAPALLDLASSAGAYVIEDCAQALGASINGHPVGTQGHMGLFSLGPRKHLPCGEGGMLVTDDGTLFQRAIVAGQHPDRAYLQATDPRLAPALSEAFWPYRMHPLAAVMGSALLPHLDGWAVERDRNHQQLCRLLEEVPEVAPLTALSGYKHAWGGLALAYCGEAADGPSRRHYARNANELGLPLRAGPVTIPLHRRQEVVNRWGQQPRCPVAERRCAQEELILRESIGWIGDQSALVEGVGSAFRQAGQCARAA
jgi:dTDP-4-amino-4,6-dideoxygalactose transaminase